MGISSLTSTLTSPRFRAQAEYGENFLLAADIQVQPSFVYENPCEIPSLMIGQQIDGCPQSSRRAAS